MINLKKISAVLSVVILLVFSVVPVNAENVLSDVSEGKYIFDLDNSLTAEDEKYLSGELDRISKMTKFDWCQHIRAFTYLVCCLTPPEPRR